jgi:thiol-disulfide isomerase/thioredoxin
MFRLGILPKITSALPLLLLSQALLASSEPPPAAPAAPKTQREKDIAKAESFLKSDDYVHKWVAFPPIADVQFMRSGKKKIQAELGVAKTFIFTASWCVPCQDLTKAFLEQQRKHKTTEFIFVFAHDVEKDIDAFMKEYNITDAAVANHELLKFFHNPPLPSIYVVDRQGWMLTRYIQVKAEQIPEWDKLLGLINSY